MGRAREGGSQRGRSCQGRGRLAGGEGGRDAGKREGCTERQGGGVREGGERGGTHYTWPAQATSVREVCKCHQLGIENKMDDLFHTYSL